MKRYQIVFTKSAEKELAKLTKKSIEKIIEANLLLEKIQDLLAAKNLKDLLICGEYE
jgi:mRNA-degrading endonuclease RelE of RelBE toxin-antitoxin system